MHTLHFVPSPFQYQTASEYLSPKIHKTPLTPLYSNRTPFTQSPTPAPTSKLPSNVIKCQRKEDPPSILTKPQGNVLHRSSEIEPASLPLQGLSYDYSTQPASLFRPFKSEAANQCEVPKKVYPLNEAMVSKSTLPKCAPHSQVTLNKVFTELTLEEAATPLVYDAKQPVATNSMWCKDDLIGKIMDYKNGLLYQKEILKATSEEIDVVIKQVNL